MRKGCIYIGTVLMVTALTTGCVKRPDGVASDKKMASVLADMELGESWLHTSSSMTSDEKREAVKAYVIKKHGMTVEEYDSTMSWYLRNPDAYYELCDLAQKQLLKTQKQLADKTGIIVESTNLWPYSRHLLFSPLETTDGLVFSIPSSDVNSGEQLRFKMRFDNAADGNALLGVEYEDGSSEFVTRRLSGVERLDLTLLTDTSRVVTRLFGNLSLNDLSKKRLWADSVHLSVQPFDSTKYYNRHTQHFLLKPSKKLPPRKEPLDSLSSDNNTEMTPGN